VVRFALVIRRRNSTLCYVVVDLKYFFSLSLGFGLDGKQPVWVGDRLPKAQARPSRQLCMGPIVPRTCM